MTYVISTTNFSKYVANAPINNIFIYSISNEQDLIFI